MYILLNQNFKVNKIFFFIVCEDFFLNFNNVVLNSVSFLLNFQFVLFEYPITEFLYKTFQ